jgi:pimeloyl-ACP methyl ester carboxylesterase
VPDVGAALGTHLQQLFSQYGYQKLSVVGHSLGGLLALIALSHLPKSVPLTNVWLLASPLHPSAYATWAARFFRQLNPHIYFLSREALIRGALSRGLAASQARTCRTVYMRCINDALVRLYRELPFSEVVEMQGAHNWMVSVLSRADDNYGLLKSEILKHC